MPAIQSGKVLVSGANGYVAVWVVKKLLEEGYTVRGTVRSEKSIPYLKQLFDSYGDKVEFIVVPDITKPGAFDDALKDIDAIAHTASPFHFNFEHPRELIDPAVLGTTGILESALKHGQHVKRVIILSSCAAVMEADGYPEPVVLTEKDWNVRAAANCEKQGQDASHADAYFASKTLAEHAAWDFAAKHKGEVTFDVVALNPPYVHGPFLQDVSAPEKLNVSLLSVYNNAVKGGQTDAELASSPGSWVDVRDLAQAHVLAFQKEAAGGERIIVASGPFTWQQWVHAAHEIDSKLPSGTAGYDYANIKFPIKHDNTKSRQILGIDYIGITRCTRDILAQFKELGWY
ncbi:NAD(P)-binding protein [Irpex rosettiformis]|uniref:NAD(P)-binding protein n=1 Tax=Irpex rosettiformis TaxID=378272 RepID=A0ACB8U4B0_9APHY|nr:NAD(P)-binding protein [Irpex rosettiformis]